jgi:hypothetical protein
MFSNSDSSLEPLDADDQRLRRWWRRNRACDGRIRRYTESSSAWRKEATTGPTNHAQRRWTADFFVGTADRHG